MRIFFDNREQYESRMEQIHVALNERLPCGCMFELSLIKYLLAKSYGWKNATVINNFMRSPLAFMSSNGELAPFMTYTGALVANEDLLLALEAMALSPVIARRCKLTPYEAIEIAMSSVCDRDMTS